ncbi:MAG: 8-amino-7-oxononanoate synthase [Candidatus Cryptobacteroides sp.]
MNIPEILKNLEDSGNMRTLPTAVHDGNYLVEDGRKMLNLSSNDYLALAGDRVLSDGFLASADAGELLFSSSSSRLLTGNFRVNDSLERHLAEAFGRPSALTFGSGYAMNSGILPAVSDAGTLILADKLVHASLIDGIRLSAARTIRFRHQDLDSLERLVRENVGKYTSIIIVVESIYSMDGDVTDLRRLVALKKDYPSVMLYVDEAHAVGVRGEGGLGIAEEQGCIADVDFLCGTFGKALASVGAYVVCSNEIRTFLINRMRPFIFTTALPPLNIAWTDYVLRHLPDFSDRRKHLAKVSAELRGALTDAGKPCPSESQIIPLMVGQSHDAVRLAAHFRSCGFYLLPIRPPTVPEGIARLRISLTASVTENDIRNLLSSFPYPPSQPSEAH